MIIEGTSYLLISKDTVPDFDTAKKECLIISSLIFGFVTIW